MTARTGYQPIDRLLEQAEARGLEVTLHERSEGRFISAHITNAGKAGDNGLNDETISLSASFYGSRRGRWAGGNRYGLCRTDMTFDRRHAARGLRQAATWIDMMYLAPEHRPAGEDERRAAESAEIDRLIAQAAARGDR